MSSKTKKQDNKKKKYGSEYLFDFIKRGLPVVITVIILITLTVWAAVAYGTAVNLIKPSKGTILSSPEKIGVEDFEIIEITAENGDLISGWYLPASNNLDVLGNKIVIMSHNYESNREMSEISGLYFYKYLIDSGYDIVAFDYSGSGTSDGSYYTFGCQEKDELLKVIDYVHQMNPDADIALCGWAFGAAAAISAGCESDLVTAIIADSSYTDLDTYLNGYMSMWTGLPSFLFDTPVKFLMEKISDCDFSDISPLSAVKNTTGKSFYFIHCTEDTVIPLSNSEELFAAAEENNYAELWTPSGEHILGFETQEENYKNRVLDFLNEHF